MAANPNLQNDPSVSQQEAGFGYLGPFWFESNAVLTALAGGGRSGAPVINAMMTAVTVANNNDSVLLPPGSFVGLSICITNTSTSKSMQVFAQSTDTVNGVAGATGVPQMANSQVWYTCSQSGTWAAQGIGSGQSGANQTYSYADGMTAQSVSPSQSTGTQINTSLARFTTVASPGNAATLIPAAPGLILTVINAGANIMSVFPASASQGGAAGGDQINSLGQNNAFALPSGAVVEFFCTLTGVWHTLLSANTTQYGYNTATNTTSFTATGAQLTGGSAEATLNLTGALGSAQNITLPTVAALVAAMTVAGLNPSPGLTYEFCLYNTSSGNFAWTVLNSAGNTWTLNGAMTVAQNTYRKFYVTLNSLTAGTLQSLGQFAIGSAV